MMPKYVVFEIFGMNALKRVADRHARTHAS